MKTERERREIFRDNILPSPFIDEYEQFKIWEDGFRVGYINGTDDMRGNRECTESSARNADIQDAYEQGYEDGKSCYRGVMERKLIIMLNKFLGEK